MKHIFKGNLRGFYCGDCFDYFYKAKVKIYSCDNTTNVTLLAVASEKNTFHQRTDAELKAVSNRLIAETETDEAGNFTIEFSEKNYNGEAFDIDFECGSVPVHFVPKTPPKPHVPVQIHITTLQPQWKEVGGQNPALLAYWEYAVSARFWCWLLKLFGLYVICGRVINCETKIPLPGLKVKAFDVDLIQDDFLGEAYTDVNGYFKIYYTEADFSKTIFSWLNVEWPAGPDLYFQVESSSGTILMKEDRQTGHRRDRANATNCFCLTLCLSNITPAETPWFTSIGNYMITTDIDNSGRTIVDRSVNPSGTGFGFFGVVKLEGYATKKVPTASGVLFYRFLYSLDNMNWNPVTDTQIAGRIRVAQRQITWHGGVDWQDVVIDKNQVASIPDSIPADNWPNPKPDHVLHLDANGWVRVDQVCLDNGFIGPLMWLNTNTLVPGGDANAGLVAGQPVAVANQKNGHLVYIKFQITDDPTNPGSPNFHEQSQVAKIYVNNWTEVTLVKLEELYSGGSTGCTPVASQAHVDYTADHELMHSWSVNILTNALPGGITGLPSGIGPRGNAQVLNLVTLPGLLPAFNTWPSCAYKLWLTTQKKLTDGEYSDYARTNEVIFCK